MPLRRRYINGPAGRGIDLNGAAFYAPLWRPDLGVAPGGTFKSLDKYGHTCTVTGATWGYQGRIFDGNDDNISCGDVTALNGATAFTIICWFNQDIIDQNDTLFKKYTDADNRIYLATIASDGSTRFYICNAANTYGSFDYSTVITAGKWHHLVTYYNGAGANNSAKMKIYVDTVEVTLGFGAMTIPTTTADLSTKAFLLGDTAGALDGVIGEMLIYNRALGVNELTRHYQATKWRYS